MMPGWLGQAWRPCRSIELTARLRIKMVHERTGTIVNGFTAQQCVIGVQYAVDKTQHLPVCDQFGETLANAIQQHGRRRASERLVELFTNGLQCRATT